MIKSKEQIKKDVKEQLRVNDTIDASNVDAYADKTGKVTLTGTVSSLNSKEAVEEIAYKILGVTDVENELDVALPKRDIPITDQELEVYIREAFMRQSVIDSSKVSVVVKNGIANLEGVVDTFWKRNIASDLASQVIGVREVKNKIAVVPTQSRTDEEIARDIMSSLDRDISADIENIDISVENGRVTLSGVVSSGIAKDAAETAAKGTTGVKDIVNDLSIRY